MSKDERLRLLLIEQEGYEQNHRTGITHGAAAVFAKWPSYIASAIWFTVFIVSLITLIMLITFMSLLNQGKIVEQSLYIPKQESQFIMAKDMKNIKSEFCDQMTTKTHEKRQNIPEKDLEVFDSGNNIFYMVLKPLDQISACSVESVLRLSPHKNVFLMALKQLQQSYEHALRLKYENFNIINIDGKTITRGSPFEGKWTGDERSLFEVALLTVWQFGGTVLSEDLLMLNDRLYEKETINCQIDPELIYCPKQCASYLYDLIGETLRHRRNLSMDSLLDSSIMKFCGSEHFIQTGCSGVIRIDKMEMCNVPDERCLFVRSREWLNIAEKNKASTWHNMLKYCPITQKYQNILDRTGHNKQTETTKINTEEHTETDQVHHLLSTQNVKEAVQDNLSSHTPSKHPKSTIRSTTGITALNSIYKTVPTVPNLRNKNNIKT